MKHKKRTNKDNKFETDMKELDFLQFQLIAAIFIFYSDIIFCLVTKELIYMLIANENTSEEPLLLSIHGISYGVIARVILFNIDIERYNQLINEQNNGNIDFPLDPNIYINLSDLFGIINYVYAYLGAVNIYERSKFIKLQNVQLLNIQLSAIEIHLISDIFFIETTLESIQLIRNKYFNEKIGIDNPDIAAVNYAITNHISRVIYVNSTFLSYIYVDKTLQDKGLNELLLANIYLIVSSISSIIESYYILVGLEGIIRRHAAEPLFV